jgi:hypothetical protein
LRTEIDETGSDEEKKRRGAKYMKCRRLKEILDHHIQKGHVANDCEAQAKSFRENMKEKFDI